ncbi:lipase family protein [Williamsia sp.]|uniref:lipase family protein n=1 Tax=Williamsia sp. TaxID=1872085 RepID=UPI001A1AF996|nr:lipase family protein [Williamsia sp.]MBJ7289150.1 alpha/beta hydrolase [Williamsia sp.]
MTRSVKVIVSVVGLVVVVGVAVALVVVWPLIHEDKDDLDVTGGSTPGSVKSAQEMTDLPLPMQLARTKAARIEYVSTDRAGKPTTVSGSVFTPGGDAPPGGWPVVAVGHGTSGIDNDCAPSRSKDLLGLIGLAQGLVGAKYAVTIADYQGLGMPGVHPYLDAATAGRNIIDSVRAVRALYGNVSTDWGGYGSSQGGGAIWAANEESATYAPELRLVGTVDAAPAADVVGLVDKARSGTLTVDQGPAVQAIIESAARTHSDIVRDDYRSGSVRANWDVLGACSGPLVARRDAAIKQIGRFELAPRDDAAAKRLTDLLESYAVPKRAAAAPMLVVFGDADTFIDPAWTRKAVLEACALGDTVEVSEQPGKGHSDIDISNALDWLVDRFDGGSAPSDCANLSRVAR